ncbi:MAG: SusC/RagA family TonB-linked outer membrane protein [Flavobacterium sp.]|nr:MAG: SusC/RagA family TonB-linked outer membrane protein [Flavobacterium sp.]
MYKFYTKRPMQSISDRMSKILLIMRLTAVLLLSAILHVNASSYGQGISLSEKNAPIKAVLEKIRKQSGLNFLFASTNLKNAKPVTINVKNTDLQLVLEEVFKNQPFEYSLENNSVVVTKKDSSLLEIIMRSFTDITVQGLVKDENDVPMAGVTVRVKGSSIKSVITDKSGSFTISVPEDSQLTLSFLGYRDKEIKAASTLNITMELGMNELNETVIIGYGTAKRKDLTGSVSSINVNEVRNVPFMSLDNAMVGKAAGVQVIKADGAPGGAVRIRVRGGTSLIGSNDPLYIIDGVPMTVTNNYVTSTEMTNPTENYGGENARATAISGSFARGLNNLAGLNMEDIESIDILKDASATAIYGSKAANGVVIVTTRKGKRNEKPILEANYYGGFSRRRNQKVLNREQYLSIMREAAQNRVNENTRVNLAQNAAIVSVANGTANLGDADTDWLDLVTRNGLTHNANLSVRGGGTNSSYFTSLSYSQQQGAVIGTDFSRLSGKINLDSEIGTRLRVNTNLDFGFTKNNITNGVYANALIAPPTISPYNTDGSFSNFDLYNVGNDFGAQNPLALATATNLGKTNLLLGSLSGEYTILKDLKFKSMVSVNFNSYKQRNYIPSYLEIDNPNGQGGVSAGLGVGSQALNESANTFIENTLSWNKEFNANHRLDVLGGQSFEKYRAEFFSAEGRTYPDDTFLNNLSSAATPTQVRGSNPSGQYALLSYYLRANYAFKDRYLLTFTGRTDISSKFAEGSQAGYFPSGAFAWKVNEEPFLKNVKWINELKIRVSAGITGTNSIADNMFRTLYTPSSYAGASAIVPSQLGNDKIKWEETLQKDLGLDYVLFNNRIRGTFGYYDKTTDGVLLNVSTAPSFAYGNVVVNVAKVQNRGLEFDIRGDVIRSKTFNWNTAFNISRNRSKVLNVNGGPFSNPNNRNAISLGTSVVREGDPLGLLWGRISTGVIRTQAELDTYKAAYSLWDIFEPRLNIGDLAYEIDPATGDAKRSVIGNALPDFFGGFTNIFNYKNFSLTTLLTFSYGNELLYQNDVSNRSVVNNVNKGIDILDHYSASNPNSSRQRLIWGSNTYNTNENIYDASYLRLKSITLGYELPRKLTTAWKIRMASLYVSSTNLFTVTNYPGLDPEVSDAPGSIIGGGRDLSTYPVTRELTFGIRLGF